MKIRCCDGKIRFNIIYAASSLVSAGVLNNTCCTIGNAINLRNEAVGAVLVRTAILEAYDPDRWPRS